MMFFSKKYKLGFSLTELSVSMAIIAMIAGSAMSVAITSDLYAKTEQTNGKLDRIEEALAGYVALNKRLPCPADGTIANGENNFGVEDIDQDVDPAVCNSNFNAGGGNPGVVPVRTLQLPDDFMFDGWGRRITYIVDARFANNESTNINCDGSAIPQDCFIDTVAGLITVVDDADANRTTEAIYVVISHGENGHGAYPKNGGNIRVNAYSASLGNPFTLDIAGENRDEYSNSHLNIAGLQPDEDYVFALREFIRSDSGTYFDDIVRFKEKSQVIKKTGAVFFDSICRDAKDINDNPSSNSCTGANDEGNCETFANEVYSRCLN